MLNGGRKIFFLGRLEPQYSVFSYRKWSIKRRYSNKRSSRISAANLSIYKLTLHRRDA